jgi:hypothetical protein
MSRVLSVLSGVAVVFLLTVLSGILVIQAGSDPEVEPSPSSGMGTAFTYQGRLAQGDEPADGPCDFAFSLFDDPEVGDPIGSSVFKTITVTRGLFTTDLDFGGVFDGTALWLEIRVRQAGGSEPYTTLLPRQRLTPAPMAIFASSVPWAGLTGVPEGFSDNVDDGTAYQAGEGLTLSDTTFAISPTYLLPQPCAEGQLPKWADAAKQWTCGDDVDTDTTYQAGAGLTLSDTTLAISPTYLLPQPCATNEIARWSGSAWECGVDQVGEGGGWSLTGNSSTVPGPQFLGTTDDVALELHVNAGRALLLEPGSSSPNVVGGYGHNSVSGGVSGATIAGGGRDLALNEVTADFAGIGGGAGNTASGYAATIGGGEGNRAGGAYASAGGGSTNTADGDNATIGGGAFNTAGDDYATVSGGRSNAAAGYYATVGGGLNITITAGFGAVAGGLGNAVGGTAAAVGGGESNTANGDHASIGGGQHNLVTAIYGTIAGGGPSEAGNPTTSNNRVYDDYGTISGGGGNVAGDDDGGVAKQAFATVGGGEDNAASAAYATVGGGWSNEASGERSVVGGGASNVVTGTYGTVGGGASNVVTGTYGTVGGGASNVVAATYGTVGGGRQNKATGAYATIAGGIGNVVTAAVGTIPGGAQNHVGGQYGFAAGHQARVEHEGSFVWSDTTGPLTTTAPNQFLINAAGGVGIGTDSPAHVLTVEGTASVHSRAPITAGLILSNGLKLQAPRALYASGDLLYAASYATNTLSFWDVSDPVNHVYLGHTTSDLQGPEDLQVVGERAYLASRNNDSLTVLHVSDPTYHGSYGAGTGTLDAPLGVHVSGKYAYVASSGDRGGGYDGLAVFDVTGRTIFATDFITTYLDGTSDVFVSGSFSYVTSRDNNRLVVFDVSDPTAVLPVSYTAEQLSAPVRVQVNGIYAYVVSRDNDRVVVYDVSSPGQIVYVGEVETTLVQPRSIYVRGNRAYVTYAGAPVTGSQCGLVVLDISDPAGIAVINVIDMSDWLKWVKGGTVEEPTWEQVPPKPVAVTGSGDRVYVANERHDSVSIFEVDYLEASVVRAGELQAAHLEVDDAAVSGELAVRGGLHVGVGGALVEGTLSVTGPGDNYIQGRLGIGPVSTEITAGVSITDYKYYTLLHPTHELDVDGEARFRVSDRNHLVLRSPNTATGDDSAYIDFVELTYPDELTPSARIAFLTVDPLIPSRTGLYFYTRGADDAKAVSRLEIEAEGNVRPGANATYTLGIDTQRWLAVYAYGFPTASDGRHKENVKDLPYGLAEVVALRPVIFNWAKGPADGRHYGLIAQEVREVLPQVVSGEEGEDGTLSIDYGELVPVLVKAVQEQQEEIDSQGERIADLETRLVALEKGQPSQEARSGILTNLSAFGVGGLVLGGLFLAGVRRWEGGP